MEETEIQLHVCKLLATEIGKQYNCVVKLLIYMYNFTLGEYKSSL